MHLSFLSDGYFSDSVADAPDAPDMKTDDYTTFGRAHRDGLIRGALAVIALAIPIILTVTLNPAQRSRAPSIEPTSQIRITHFSLKSIGLD